MATAFTPIRITGMDDKASRPRDEHSAIVRVVLTLSASAPSEWADHFNQRWQGFMYNMKRRASVNGGTLEIECVPDELETDHLPQLKRAIDETNQAYAAFAENQARQHEADAIRKAEGEKHLEDIKGRLNFD